MPRVPTFPHQGPWHWSLKDRGTLARGRDRERDIRVTSVTSAVTHRGERAELIEAAAQAIRTVCANRSGRGKPSHELPEKMRQDYRREAEAALEAVGVIQ
jgi:hypothetical protein